MQAISPLTDPESGPKVEPYDLNAEIPAVEPPVEPAKERELVMGPRQVASLAFVGILLLGIMSAMAYFAGRKNTDAPKVTERVVERIVQVPAPAAPVPAVVTPAPAPAAPVKAAEPQRQPPQEKAEVTAPILNRVYLQAGSVEVGVAEVMVEGLRQRGVPAIVGIGINTRVARVLIGPFNSLEEQKAAQKKVEDLGFHPFPRAFTAKDLEQQQVTLSEPTSAKP